MDNQNLDTTESQWTSTHNKSKTRQILLGVIAVLFVFGVAGASYYVSNQLSARVGIAPTAPESEPEAAAGCKDAKGKSKCKEGKETCENNRCVKIKTPEPTTYKCSSQNCPGPAFYCSSSTNCANSPGWENGVPKGGGGGGGTTSPTGPIVTTTPVIASGCTSSRPTCVTGSITGMDCGGSCSTGNKGGYCCAVPGSTTTSNYGSKLCSFCSAGKCVDNDFQGCTQSGSCYSDSACAGSSGSTNQVFCAFCSLGKCVTRDVQGCLNKGSCTSDNQCSFTGGSSSKILCSYCSNGKCLNNDVQGCVEKGSCNNDAACEDLPACPSGAGGPYYCSASSLSGGKKCRQAGSAEGYCCSSGQIISNGACITASSVGGGGGGSTTIPTKGSGGGGGGGGGGGTPPPASSTKAPTPTATPTPVPPTPPAAIAGACMEIFLYSKKTDGTFNTTPMTTQEKQNIKIGDTIRLAIRANKASLLARFRVSFNNVVMMLPGPIEYPSAPNQRFRQGFMDPQTKLISYYDFTATRAGEYKFEGFVSTDPQPLTCGGFAGTVCPVGFRCVMESNVPDALGICVQMPD